MADPAPTTPPAAPPTVKALNPKPVLIVLFLVVLVVGGLLVDRLWINRPPSPVPPPRPPAVVDVVPEVSVSGLYFPLASPGAKGSAGAPLGLFRGVAKGTSNRPFRWKIKGPGPVELSVFSPDGGQPGSIVEGYPTVPGTYRLHGIASGHVKGDPDADVDTFEVEVGDPTPPKPPDPPKPPPDPPKPPEPPPAPAPIPVAGLRVLVVFESSEESKYKPDQINTIYGQEFRDYCAAHCAKNAKGQPELRIYDKDVNTAGESEIWQAAMKRPHPTLPWLVVSNGTTGFEGPLPDTRDAIMATVKKYEVKP
jgi:hypothetical protein